MVKHTSEVVLKNGDELETESWYQTLVDECQAIKVELNTIAAISIFKRNWEIGKLVLEENTMEREKTYGKRIIDNLSKDLGFSASALYQFIQFYKNFPATKYKEFEKVELELPKNMTWGRYVKEELGERSKEQKPKTSFKIEDITEVLKSFLEDDIGLTDETEIDKAIDDFKKLLIEYTKE